MSTSNTPASASHSASPAPDQAGRRHVLTAVERQRSQLDRLLKDPSKPAYVPPAPKEKTIRPAREMMKNVQGSSAGAGSGEFHVYKASRRREYERLKMMEDEARIESETAEFEKKRKEADDVAEAKTAKNRAKRQKKKERAKVKPSEKGEGKDGAQEAPLKKRRLVNGKELVFRKPGEESDEEEVDAPADHDKVGLQDVLEAEQVPPEEAPRVAQEQRIIFHEDD
ncbi:DUF1168-domain-containing protein [Suillus clintonianus]|uniref:DUF1168-domain-containing protein n=1 Tax=Suillus clintonianus TaxID=1904413 RepID=UPI001B863D78|nr:DUF1168-domain-containing protein [Suillus clintonianus]KAG2150594.1 DUF1168-domain-containing protein [Suillus clintonianus]